MGTSYYEEVLQETAEDRTNFKRTADNLDIFASNHGFVCGIPVALMFCCMHEEHADMISLSRSFLEPLIEHGVLKIKPDPPAEEVKEIEQEDEWVLHREWFLTKPWKGQHGAVQIWKSRLTGKFQKDFVPTLMWQNRFEMLGKTTAMLLGFGIEEAEIKARSKLESLLSASQKRSLLLCDSFYELGKSGILYWIRKNRPTIALRPDPESEEDGKASPLCALCFHPLGYYTGTFAGFMTPSDDMLAHLLIIRANEHLFWKKSNQHPLDSHVSGI